MFSSVAIVTVVLIIMGEGRIEEQNITTEYTGTSIKCVAMFPE